MPLSHSRGEIGDWTMVADCAAYAHAFSSDNNIRGGGRETLKADNCTGAQQGIKMAPNYL